MSDAGSRGGALDRKNAGGTKSEPGAGGESALAGANPGFAFAVAEIFTSSEWSCLKRRLELSPRQADIARRLLEGAGDKQIAQSLAISVSTVRTHLGRLFSKLRVQDRGELIVHLFREHRHAELERANHRQSH